MHITPRRVNDSARSSAPREAIDCRGMAVIFAAIAHNDADCLIPSALVTAAQVALHHQDDGDLAHWLNDAILQIRDLRRIFDAHSDANQRTLFETMPVGFTVTEQEPAHV